ncbi:MAG TPA: hypothetical protein VKI18_12200 [Albitalea sp.]|nr:hypothetical protein [Albitalea sp.]
MVTPPIPVKTADGQAELASRQRRVSQRHRTVLFLIDGKRTADEVRALARQAGSSDTCFNELLDLGMIKLPEAVLPAAAGSALHVDIPLEAPVTPAASAAPAARAAPGADDAEESLLPAARTLQPESVLTDSMLGGLGDAPLSESMLAREVDGGAQALPADADRSLEEARGILLRAVRSEAPLAGSLTILRLRRARSRSELAGLIDEVEARIVKPYRSLAAQQTLRRARELLVTPAA